VLVEQRLDEIAAQREQLLDLRDDALAGTSRNVNGGTATDIITDELTDRRHHQNTEAHIEGRAGTTSRIQRRGVAPDRTDQHTRNDSAHQSVGSARQRRHKPMVDLNSTFDQFGNKVPCSRLDSGFSRSRDGLSIGRGSISRYVQLYDGYVFCRLCVANTGHIGSGRSNQMARRSGDTSLHRSYERLESQTKPLPWAVPPTAVSRAFPSWNRSILTEIYRCHACSYQVISKLRMQMPGQVPKPGGTEDPLPPRARAYDRWSTQFCQPKTKLSGASACAITLHVQDQLLTGVSHAGCPWTARGLPVAPGSGARVQQQKSPSRLQRRSALNPSQLAATRSLTALPDESATARSSSPDSLWRQLQRPASTSIATPLGPGGRLGTPVSDVWHPSFVWQSSPSSRHPPRGGGGGGTSFSSFGSPNLYSPILGEYLALLCVDLCTLGFLLRHPIMCGGSTLLPLLVVSDGRYVWAHTPGGLFRANRGAAGGDPSNHHPRWPCDGTTTAAAPLAWGWLEGRPAGHRRSVATAGALRERAALVHRRSARG
jgi:hypothetical protein